MNWGKISARLFWIFSLCVGLYFGMMVDTLQAARIFNYSDLISDSAPGAYADHTLSFTIQADVSPGGYIEITPPNGFSIRSTSTFSERNVELYVNGGLRAAGPTLSSTTDQVLITTGSPGLIRYNLNSTEGLSNGDQLELRIGDHTAQSLNGGEVFIIGTGTTTLPNDVAGIQNATTTGTHTIAVTIGGASESVQAGFLISVNRQITVGPLDTTEQIPPFRFNGAPTGTVGGTTLAVDLSVETDELATCRYATASGTPYASMISTFDTTGQIVHSTLFSSLTNDTQYNFFVRCIDDEGNFNTDDYLISFYVLPAPSGEPNADGDVAGDGGGTGNSGSGGGAGTSGNSSDGSTGDGGGGSGGGGGGGGGGTGNDDGSNEPGGFSDGEPYESGDGQVIINGYAFPGSEVTVLVDGFEADTSRADSAGKYSVTVSDIARGVYTFAIYAVDDNGVKSTTFSTSFSVIGSRSVSLSNINIMPSILVNPDPVDPGETVTVSGFALPDAEITLQNQKEGGVINTFTTTSDGSGEWSIAIDTSGFTVGTYKARAKSEQSGGIETDYSDYTFYGVGAAAAVPTSADLNVDGDVNLIDFSILLFWWGSDGGDSSPPADISQDGQVSLTDFSIMLFQWTG